MFLAQNVTKFLKEIFQEPKNSHHGNDELFSKMKRIKRNCGLDPDDTSSDPAFHSLMGNSWHGMFPGDD
jgi:hypothetical protein